MAFPTLSVKDGNNVSQTINTTPNAGQATMANSLPVTFASDQSALPVTGTFYQTTQPVSGAASAYADGWDITQGTKADTAYTGTGSASVVSALKGVYSILAAPLPAGTNAIGSVTTAQLPTTVNGTNLSAASLSVVLPQDQAVLTFNSDYAQIIGNPSSNSIAALNGTIVWSVEGGSGYILSLTNGPGATTAWAGTVTFQYSVNGGTSWSSLNAVPLSSFTGATVTTTTANGLWQVNPPNGANVQIRANMTAYTSGTVYADLAPAAQANATIVLPWTYSVTSGAVIVGPTLSSGFAEFSIQIAAITTTVLTVQGTNDPTLTTWNTIPVVAADAATNVSLITISAAGSFRWSAAGYKYTRVVVSTTGTVLTVTGVQGRLGVTSSPLSTLQNTSFSISNINTIGNNIPVYSISNGSTNKAAGVTVSTAVSQVDQNATAFAGSGAVNGTTVASAQGSGAVISSEINVSALTLGTATAVFLILQESTGGTNFTDIWISDPFTATGIQRMPAIPVAGRRRWRAFSVGGTSTTVTVTITSLELPAGYVVTRQMRDAYAATNPLALQYNSTALTASNFVLGTASTVTTPFYIEGCKNLTAFMVLAGGPTVTTQPVVGLQLSMDGTNWFTVTGSTMTAAGNGMYAIVGQNVGGAKFARLIVSTAATYSSGSYTISNIGVNGVN